MRKAATYLALSLGLISCLAFSTRVAKAEVLFYEQTFTSANNNFIDVNSAGSGTVDLEGSVFTSLATGDATNASFWVPQYYAETSYSFFVDFWGGDLPDDGTCRMESEVYAASPGGYTDLGEVPFTLMSGKECPLVEDEQYDIRIGRLSQGGGNQSATVKAAMVGGAGTAFKMTVTGPGAPASSGEIVVTFPTAPTSTPDFSHFWYESDIDETWDIQYAAANIVFAPASSTVDLDTVQAGRSSWPNYASAYVGGTTQQIEFGNDYVAQITNIAKTQVLNPGQYRVKAFLYAYNGYPNLPSAGDKIGESEEFTFTVTAGQRVFTEPDVVTGSPYNTSTTVNPLSEEALHCDDYPIFEYVEFDFVVGEIEIPWPADTFVEGSVCQAKLAAGQIGEFLFVPGQGAQTFLLTALNTFKGVFPFNMWFGIRDAVVNGVNTSASSTQELSFVMSYPDHASTTIPLFTNSVISETFNVNVRDVWFNAILAFLCVMFSWMLLQLIMSIVRK